MNSRPINVSLEKGIKMLRKELREHIFKMLFQIEFNEPEDMKEHLKLYFESLEDASDKEKEYIQKKYEAVVSHVPEIDALINERARDWKTARMNKADLTVLRLAVYELKWDDEIPTGVAINEVVELARKCGGDASPSFVNGILGKLAEAEPQG